MQPRIDHRWDLTIDEAEQLQRTLARDVVVTDDFAAIKHVAGVDVAYHKQSGTMIGCMAILDAVTLQLVGCHFATGTARFPYIPGLFSFRELPVLMAALAKVECAPDLIICDGQGIAHPRRFGLASHLGLLYDIPTIGCAKTWMTGAYDQLSDQRGSIAPMIDNGQTIGAALRTQTGTKPMFVSTGHRISLQSACNWILRLSPRYRLPETTRAADHAVKMALKSG